LANNTHLLIALRFAMRSLMRDLRGRQLTVLFISLVIALAALSSVGFLTSRMEHLIREQADVVLAADLRLESARPIDQDNVYRLRAQASGLQTASTISFSSVVFAGGSSQLVNVIAADRAYPLRGAIRLSLQPFASALPVVGGPSVGVVWADPRLLTRLGIPVGGSLALGDLSLSVAASLDYRPDQGAGFADLAPTVLINQADLLATHLLVSGSRATWTLLVAGSAEQIAAYQQWLRAHKKEGERLVDPAESNNQLHSAIVRAGRFLNLAALVTLLLSSVAIAMAARRFASTHLDFAALLKCMGASQRFILLVTAGELLLLGLSASMVGIAAGYISQLGLSWLLKGLMKVSVPQPSWTPVWLCIGTAIALLLGFALPPLLELKQVPPARVLSRHVVAPALRYGLPYLMAAGALVTVLYVLVQDYLLAAQAGTAAVVAGATLYVAGRALVKVTHGVRGAAGVAWRYGLSNIARRGHESAVQVVAFGLGLAVLLLLLIVRQDLMREWQHSLPVAAPNHFLINIPPADVSALNHLLVSNNVASPTFSPWVRGRLIAVNDSPIAALTNMTERGQRFADREQNLSWSQALPPDNQIVAGAWWSTAGAEQPSVSVATEFQESLHLRLGDRLSFDIAGEKLVATLTSVRKVRWDGFRPNFFLVFSPGVLDSSTGTSMTSVYLDAHQRLMLADLVKQFPSVTVFDIQQIMQQVNEIVDRASDAIQVVFGFSLLAGMLVLLAAIQATRQERRFESALLRTLGASRRLVLSGVVVEFMAIGVLAGVLAACAASLAGWWLSVHLFHLPYRFNGLLWLGGVVAGTVLVGVTGTLATWSVLRAPPSGTLREG